MTVGGADRDALVELLKRPRYEVFPLAGIEQDVTAHVPRDVKVAITSSPTRGIETTIQLAEELVRRGYEVVPHLAARLVADDAHLKRILARLREAGVREALVIGGDIEEPAGRFASAFELLAAMTELGDGLDSIGIAGYPESHPFISDEATIKSMSSKAPLATHIVSQLCFEPRVIGRWIADVRARGMGLPIYIGIPGAVGRARLVRISSRIGVGESTRFLRRHGSLLARLFLRGSYSPGFLVDGLRPYVGDPRNGVGGFHVYTFNEVGRTERWRQETIRRLGEEAAA
ncbi:MAG: methylenetetrahydrofolate reductase [Gaiellaceae bacterium]